MVKAEIEKLVLSAIQEKNSPSQETFAKLVRLYQDMIYGFLYAKPRDPSDALDESRREVEHALN